MPKAERLLGDASQAQATTLGKKFDEQTEVAVANFVWSSLEDARGDRNSPRKPKAHPRDSPANHPIAAGDDSGSRRWTGRELRLLRSRKSELSGHVGSRLARPFRDWVQVRRTWRTLQSRTRDVEHVAT